MIVIEVAKTAYSDIETFYRSVGEDVLLGPGERVAVVHEDSRVIGAARLTYEEGHLVLRTVNVDPLYQRRGIGTNLVGQICGWAGTTPLYCLPYPHLKQFYERFGFKEVDAHELPSFLAKRRAEYTLSFPIISMRRN